MVRKTGLRSAQISRSSREGFPKFMASKPTQQAGTAVAEAPKPERAPERVKDGGNGAGAANAYTADSIKVLGGMEAVRRRHAMYIGSTGEMGLHHLVYEVVDNSVDEAIDGNAEIIEVKINIDNSITVIDDRLGIPVTVLDS